MSVYIRKKDGLFRDPKTGRTIEHQGLAVRIYWSEAMLSYLRRHFPTTLNEELAGCLGVSMRTLSRKAQQLGLRKDPDWLHRIWDERRIMAQVKAKRCGNPGHWKKGEHSNPEYEFKPGRKPTDEEKAKHAESMKRWYRRNPEKARAKALKAWATRRAQEAL